MKYFVNISNHPIIGWSEEQRTEAENFVRGEGILIEFPFPQLDPEATEFDILPLAEKTLVDILNAHPDDEFIFHIMGEMTFVYHFVKFAENFANRVICVASTTKRDVTENEDGSKTSKFKFVRFRQYL